jgi:hypothetical protein
LQTQSRGSLCRLASADRLRASRPRVVSIRINVVGASGSGKSVLQRTVIGLGHGALDATLDRLMMRIVIAAGL